VVGLFKSTATAEEGGRLLFLKSKNSHYRPRAVREIFGSSRVGGSVELYFKSVQASAPHFECYKFYTDLKDAMDEKLAAYAFPPPTRRARLPKRLLAS
jgi:hypothetical protein